MPLEELLAIYRYEASVSTTAGSSLDSSSGELADELPDMTLDKVAYVDKLNQFSMSSKIIKPSLKSVDTLPICRM